MLFSAIASGAITVSALLLGLAEPNSNAATSASATAGAYAVSASQGATIRATRPDLVVVPASAIAMCNYNVTMHVLLAGTHGL
jgi:hypothetical protein